MPRSSALLLPALAALLLTPGCPRTPAPRPPDLTPLDPTEVIEWFLGEQVRGPTTSNRRTHLGILTRSITANPSQAGELRPNSCAPGLVSFIPTPAHSGVWLASDDTGQLLRYAGDGWSPVTSTITLPRIGRLLAIAGTAARLELLVALDEGDTDMLSLLVLVDDVVTEQRTPDRAQLPDRSAALQRFDNARCLADARDCLHVAEIDSASMITREPVFQADRVEIPLPANAKVQDVRYADATGTTIDILTPDACPSENSPPAEPDPETAPEP